MKKIAVLAALLLVACSKPDPAKVAEDAALRRVGRYQIQAVSVPIVIGGAAGQGVQAYAWRIDTTNGNLELCNYLYTPAYENAGKRISCDH